MKFFLVEDSLEVRELIAITVQNAGGEVAGAAVNKEMALRDIAITRPDIMVIDIRLQQGNAFDVIRAVKEQYPEIAIIVLTAESKKLFETISLQIGAGYYFEKSVNDFERFQQFIKKIVKDSLEQDIKKKA